MKIALLGYGRMGKEIEKIAVSRGNEIVLKIGADNLDDLTQENLSTFDICAIITNHDEVDYDLIFRNSQLILDTRNVYSGNKDKKIIRLGNS